MSTKTRVEPDYDVLWTSWLPIFLKRFGLINKSVLRKSWKIDQDPKIKNNAVTFRNKNGDKTITLEFTTIWVNPKYPYLETKASGETSQKWHVPPSRVSKTIREALMFLKEIKS